MSRTLVVVVPDADVLAATVASRLVAKIVDAQAERGNASIVLTGGRIAAKVLGTVKELPAAAAPAPRTPLPRCKIVHSACHRYSRIQKSGLRYRCNGTGCVRVRTPPACNYFT